MPVLRSVEVKWCAIQAPNTQFEHVYEVQCMLSPEQAKTLQDESKSVDPKGKGIKIKKDDDGNLFIRFKRKAIKPDGTSTIRPVCVSRDGKTPFEKLVGNGSICNVQYTFIKYNNPKFGEGVTTDFKGLQVLEHVAFGEADGEVFGDEDSEFSNESIPKSSAKPKPKSKPEFDEDDFG